MVVVAQKPQACLCCSVPGRAGSATHAHLAIEAARDPLLPPPSRPAGNARGPGSGSRRTVASRMAVGSAPGTGTGPSTVGKASTAHRVLRRVLVLVAAPIAPDNNSYWLAWAWGCPATRQKSRRLYWLVLYWLELVLYWLVLVLHWPVLVLYIGWCYIGWC